MLTPDLIVGPQDTIEAGHGYPVDLQYWIETNPYAIEGILDDIARHLGDGCRGRPRMMAAAAPAGGRCGRRCGRGGASSRRVGGGGGVAGSDLGGAAGDWPRDR